LLLLLLLLLLRRLHLWAPSSLACSWTASHFGMSFTSR